MKARLLIALLALGLILGGIFGWKDWQGRQLAAQTGQETPPAMVAAAEVRQESWRPRLESVGSLVAIQGIIVTNEVPGTVRSIHVESGQTVEGGALLVELDSAVERAELDGLQAAQRLAELEFARDRELLQERSVSRSAYDASEARLREAKARVAAKQALLDKKRIQAPFAGRLGIRRVDQGQFLDTGSPIIALQALDPIFVDYRVPERHLGRLTLGGEVRVWVQAWPAVSIRGRIRAMEPLLDPGSRSVRVRAELPNPDGQLRPGMFARIHTLMPEPRRVLTLPRSAITYRPYGDSVFRLQRDADQRLVAHNVRVRTGEVRNERVEVVEGLDLGEQVVSAGQVKLQDGQRVAIDEASSAALEAR